MSFVSLRSADKHQTELKMRSIIVVCLFVLAAMVYARPEEKYTDKFDNIDLLEILNNPRLFTPYMDCLFGKGKCPPPAKELKTNIPDALQNKCAKCTDAQKEGSRTVFRFLINKKPEAWQQLKAKYDPDEKYSKEYEKELKEIQA